MSLSIPDRIKALRNGVILHAFRNLYMCVHGITFQYKHIEDPYWSTMGDSEWNMILDPNTPFTVYQPKVIAKTAGEKIRYLADGKQLKTGDPEIIYALEDNKLLVYDLKGTCFGEGNGDALLAEDCEVLNTSSQKHEIL